MPPDPTRCKRLWRLRKIYSRAYIFKIPRYAPAYDTPRNTADCRLKMIGIRSPQTRLIGFFSRKFKIKAWVFYLIHLKKQGVIIENINRKVLQRTANEYTERRIYKDLISKNNK